MGSSTADTMGLLYKDINRPNRPFLVTPISINLQPMFTSVHVLKALAFLDSAPYFSGWTNYPAEGQENQSIYQPIHLPLTRSFNSLLYTRSYLATIM